MQEYKSLDNIFIKTLARPIKIAYIVPFEDLEQNHWVLDAIFYESYTRWGGAKTLIFPATKNKFLDEGYDNWLEYYDPDFIYSYVELSKEFIEKISCLSSPISFLSHQDAESEISRWRDYLANTERYCCPVPSLTTLHTISRHLKKGQLPSIVTQAEQWTDIPSERFLADNFGISHHTTYCTNPIDNFYETLSSVPEDTPESSNVGTNRAYSLAQVLNALRNPETVTFAQLSSLCSDNIDKMNPPDWNGFQIFVGDTCLDRINFWNARLLATKLKPRNLPSSLIIRENLFNNSDFLKALGTLLNEKNFLKRGNSSIPCVVLRSCSVPRETLAECKNSLRKHTHNEIRDPKEHSVYAIPPNAYMDKPINFGSEVGYGEPRKITEDLQRLEAPEPDHFKSMPNEWHSLKTGQWSLDVLI